MKLYKTIIWLAVALVLIAIMWYLWLPPIALSSPSFWWCLIATAAIITLALFGAGNDWGYCEMDNPIPGLVSLGVAVLALVILMLGGWAGSSFFNAQTYNELLAVENTTFESEFDTVNWDSVPQIDKASCQILGARKMGTLTNEVSQFEVQSTYTLINFDGKPVRVSPLGYAGFFKYKNNKATGIPGYIVVDCVTKDAEFVRMEKGMKYSPTAFFQKDLKRHLRLQYPSLLFASFSFEIDDEGNPFYVAPTYRYKKGIGGAKEPTGCILIDPVTGQTTQYTLTDVPEWIDHALTGTQAVKLIDWWGKFGGGWWNSWVSQKDVRTSTMGYNYVTLNNDVYLYTGITSVALDESNIGFMLVNMRTAEAKYFEMPSAEEYSAMDSAKGQVQHLGYESTFPILINLNGEATYFLSLKDAAGLVKMYALVSVENIQRLIVTDSALGIDHLVKEYSKTAGMSNGETQSTEFVIARVYTAVLEGNTQYYFEDENGNIYMTDISTSVKLPVYDVGDKVYVKYSNTNIPGYYTITEIE